MKPAEVKVAEEGGYPRRNLDDGDAAGVSRDLLDKQYNRQHRGQRDVGESGCLEIQVVGLGQTDVVAGLGL